MSCLFLEWILLGNDLTSRKVSLATVVSDKPVDSEETRQLENEASEFFPVCGITRAIAALEAIYIS